MYLVCILGGIEIFDSLKFLKIFGDRKIKIVVESKTDLIIWKFSDHQLIVITIYNKLFIEKIYEILFSSNFRFIGIKQE